MTCFTSCPGVVAEDEVGHRREFPHGLDGVKGLGELFQTSLTATAIRYASLYTEPVAVVVSEGDRIPFCPCRSPAGSV
jgi:hypothetical protein